MGCIFAFLLCKPALALSDVQIDYCNAERASLKYAVTEIFIW